jgi:hypothetical protein
VRESDSWLGVDVAARRLHLAVLDADGGLLLDEVAPGDLGAWAAARRPGLRAAAVDAPAAWADDAHAADVRVAPKFRRRCAEAVLARRDPPHFVSWPSPGADEPHAPAHGWVAVGIAVHAALRAAGLVVDECWPHASWQRLADARRLPAKAGDEGLRLRRALLVDAGLDAGALAGAGHDHLDAAVAAFTAATVDEAERRRAACDEPDHPQRAAGIVLPTRRQLCGAGVRPCGRGRDRGVT